MPLVRFSDIFSHFSSFLGACVSIAGFLNTCASNDFPYQILLDQIHHTLRQKQNLFIIRWFFARSENLSITPCNTFGTKLFATASISRKALSASMSFLMLGFLSCYKTSVIYLALFEKISNFLLLFSSIFFVFIKPVKKYINLKKKARMKS